MIELLPKSTGEAAIWFGGILFFMKVLGVGFKVVDRLVDMKLAADKGSGGHGNGRVDALVTDHDEWKDEVKDGFRQLELHMHNQHTELGAKLDATSQELHRRISDFKEAFVKSQVEAAKELVTKDDLKEVREEVRQIEHRIARNGSASQ